MRERRPRLTLWARDRAITYRFFMVRPRPRLQLSQIPSIAKDLHHTMYTHFAAGNLQPVEGQICDGMLKSLRARLQQRAPGTSLKWTLHKHLSRPRLVSYKAAVLPPGKHETSRERNGLAQAVVRIHSLQSLQHVKRVSTRDAQNRLTTRDVVVDAQGRELPPLAAGAVPKDAKEAVEYIVVQRSLRKSREGPWKLWGTAEETTPARLKKKGGDATPSSRELLART